MTGGARRWAENISEESKRSTLRHAMEHGAEGLLDAREDIRKKLVDEAWFGRSTSERDAPSQTQDEHAGTVWEGESVQDVVQKDAEATEQSEEWEGHKAKAEDLYGRSTSTNEEDREFYGKGPEHDDREPG